MGRFKQVGLVVCGMCLGVLFSLHFAANAAREVPTSDLPVEEVRQLAEVFNVIKQNYVEPVEDKKLINDAISGMVAGLDPHSTYLDEDAFKDLQVVIKGEFGGLGIEVSMEDGLVKVISPIEDTPAFRAGIKSGDLIYKIDGTSVKGLSISDAVKLMRGAPDTQVTLGVFRKGELRPLDFKMTRKVIKIRSVKSKLIEPGYGYVRVTQFQEQTTADLAKQLEDLSKSGPLKGLILDLRNNPGGLIDSAVGVSAAFLPQKSLVVYSEGRTPDTKRRYLATPDDYAREAGDQLKNLPKTFRTVPMVVIINGGSASASEIVAGALQDYKRAKILGIRSFGKGSVQSIFPVVPGKSGIKITIAKYFTPNGRSIQAKGIEPDFAVDETPNGSSEPFQREADLNRHLLNPNDQSSPAAAASVPKPVKPRPVADEDNELPKFEIAGKGDFQFEQALNLLKGLPVVIHKNVTASAPEATVSAP
jgi:carboxyl-terminal processing protease